jgi:hypothetical protein
VARGGGWLSPEQVAALRNINTKAEKFRRRQWKRHLAAERESLDQLSTIYDRIHGLAPPDEAEQLAEAVEPFVDRQPGVSPEPRIDWQSLLNSANAVARLTEALIEIDNNQQDERAVELLIMAA